MDTSSIITALFLASLVMLFVVTGGIFYLSSMTWRDRRRREKEQ